MWSAIQITTASGICAVLDLVLTSPEHYHGFIPQERFRLGQLDNETDDGRYRLTVLPFGEHSTVASTVDRSAGLPTGGFIEQADGTAWMALYCQNMFEMALELALYDPVYEDMALKFLEHFLYIAAAMDRMGEHKENLWDEEDGFFYADSTVFEVFTFPLLQGDPATALTEPNTMVISETAARKYFEEASPYSLLIDRMATEPIANCSTA